MPLMTTLIMFAVNTTEEFMNSKTLTCTLNASPTWKLVCDIVDSPEKLCDTFLLELRSVHFFDWICEHCCLCYANDQRLIEQLESDKASTNPIISHRSKVMDQMLTVLKQMAWYLQKILS